MAISVLGKAFHAFQSMSGRPKFNRCSFCVTIVPLCGRGEGFPVAFLSVRHLA